MLRCCTSDEIATYLVPRATFTDEAGCEASLVSYFDALSRIVRPNVDRGWVGWDAHAAADCVASIEQADCADIPRGVMLDPAGGPPSRNHACAARYFGLLSDGAACTIDYDCASGYCVRGSNRVCAALPRLGEACTDLCAEGTACDLHTSPGTCVSLARDGTPCDPGFPDLCASGNCRAVDHTCGFDPQTICLRAP